MLSIAKNKVIFMNNKSTYYFYYYLYYIRNDAVAKRILNTYINEKTRVMKINVPVTNMITELNYCK